MTSYSSLKNDAQIVQGTTNDQELKRLATVVGDLAKKVQQLERDVEKLKRQFRVTI
jgi:outer membrane murein-binding lipoprotein Lpp